MDTLILNADGQPLSMLPISVVPWEVSIRLLTLEKIKVLKFHDNWNVRSPSVTMQVPSVAITTEYQKWNRIVKYSRDNVFLRDNFKCQYCGEKFSIKKLTIDHVLPRKHGGKTNWKNVTTACMKCNSVKGHDETIVPKNAPHKPSYYEMVSKRRNHPIMVRDKAWADYLDWPEDLIKINPKK